MIFALLKHRVWYVQIAELRPADDGYGFVDVPTELPGSRLSGNVSFPVGPCMAADCGCSSEIGC